MNKTALKPCPRCGATADMIRPIPVRHEDGYKVRFDCWECEYLGPIRETTTEAAEAWNAEADHLLVADIQKTNYGLGEKGEGLRLRRDEAESKEERE